MYVHLKNIDFSNPWIVLLLDFSTEHFSLSIKRISVRRVVSTIRPMGTTTSIEGKKVRISVLLDLIDKHEQSGLIYLQFCNGLTRNCHPRLGHPVIVAR